MKVIALTGGIGCGKTTASELFQNEGMPCINADTLCHELYSSADSRLLKMMVARWGRNILSADGSPDRKIIADIVFRDQKELEALGNMIQPLAREETERRLEQFRADGEKVVLLDVPLLYEAGWDALADKVIAIWTPPEMRDERLKQNRGWDETEIRRRCAAQMDAQEKLERADYGIINSGDKAFLAEQCRRVWLQIRKDLNLNEDETK